MSSWATSGLAQDFEEIYQALSPKDSTDYNQFGYTVSISGPYAVVGAPRTDNWDGAAFVFERDNTGNWKLVQELIESTPRTFSSNFGYSVSVSGNFALIGVMVDSAGANGENMIFAAGSAYLFERNASGVWEEKQKITASDRSREDWFGSAVFLEGNTAMVGAQGDRDINGDNYLEGAGAVYFFERNTTTGLWVQRQKLTASKRQWSGTFGSYPTSISVSGD